LFTHHITTTTQALEGDMTKNTKTRELWLEQAVRALTPLFKEQGATVPTQVRVSVGFPKGRKGNKGNAIGQCWAGAAAADGVHQVFISPVLTDPVQILGVLVHELVHAVDDCQSGHVGAFRKLATSLGLTGKMTATTVGEELAPKLEKIAAKLGPFNHAQLGGAEGRGIPKQTTRQLLVECLSCGCKVRMTRMWIETAGTPTCGCGGEMDVAL
jgi:hypothetical protein